MWLLWSREISAWIKSEEIADTGFSKLLRVFKHFLIGNGYITTDVLKEIFKELDNTITADDLDTMIEEIDSDGSGTVDFEGKTK